MQGIVSVATGEPLVQFRQVAADGTVIAMWQQPPADAREHAQMVIEAAMNAVYDAALIAWAKTAWPDDPNMGAGLVDIIRTYRADTWGLPDQPDDWRPPPPSP